VSRRDFAPTLLVVLVLVVLAVLAVLVPTTLQLERIGRRGALFM
jgi:hypothetical protein